MVRQLKLGDVAIDVVFKNIKNVHLSVYPPTGRVRISAPSRMSLDTIRVFAISRLGWIRQQQKKLREQDRETPREYVDRESHYVWGKRYLLKVEEADAAPIVTLKHKRMILQVRPSTTRDKRRAVVEEWYRELLKEAVQPLIEKWQSRMGVSVKRVFVQKMKTKWGGCSPKTKSIRLNTELAKKPKECLEYILVHEMAHMLEPTHNDQFVALMDQFIPRWKYYRDALNRLPLRHQDWSY